MRYFVTLMLSLTALLISTALIGTSSQAIPSIPAENNKTVEPLRFSAQEQAWLKANKSVTVIGDASWLPYEGFDSSGRYVGIVAEVLNLISAKSGLLFDVKETPSWRHSLQFSGHQQVDIISASASNPVIEKNYLATYSTIKSPIVMIAHNDMHYISDLSAAAGLRVALIGTAGYSKQIVASYPEVNFIEIDEIDEGLLGVAEDHYDLVLMSMMVASYQMATLGLYELRVAGITDLEMELTLFVNRSKPVLWSIIDKVKRHETKQEHHKILSKWAANNSDVIHYSPNMERFLIVIGLLLLLLVHRYFLLKKQAKQLTRLVQQDSLTNTHNRPYLQKLFSDELEQSIHHRRPLTLIMVKVNGLRRVNEKHGYLAGDRLLKQFSMLIKDTITTGELLGRWGAGQFIIVCANSSAADAELLADKVRAEVEKTIFIGLGKKTARVAVSEYRSPESAEQFLDRADKALVETKHQ